MSRTLYLAFGGVRAVGGTLDLESVGGVLTVGGTLDLGGILADGSTLDLEGGVLAVGDMLD